ncbi:MAG: calcium-binding protein [Rhodobacterales bacterium]|nr:calcium-binding protein [Rhodobacterales bacterium]
MAIITSGSTQTGTGLDDFIIGMTEDGANNTVSAGAGDDLIYGDLDVVNISAGITAAGALNMTANTAFWSLSENEDIANSKTIPHATSVIQGDGDPHWYAFTLEAGQSLTVDTDYGNHEIGENINSRVEVYAANGTTLLSSNETGIVTNGGLGSTSSQDAMLTFTADTAGTYLVKICESDGTGADAGQTLVANFSLTGQTVSTIPTSQGNDVLNGGDGNDIIYGNGGNDTLNGDDGIDQMHGGSGNDIINGGVGKDVAFGGDGSDTFRLSVDQFFEDVDGGAGIDSVDLSASAEAFTVDLQTRNMSFTGNTYGSNGTYKVTTVENVTGTAHADVIIGSTVDNALYGGSGADSISGGDGIDTMSGGADSDTVAGGKGNDIYLVSDSGDTLIEGSTEGTADIARASGSFVLGTGVGIETIQTVDSAATTAINLTGNALAQTISGNAGANTLTSGAGAADLLQGGNGNDIYVVNNSGDKITEGTGGGTDTVRATVDYVLGSLSQVEAMSTNNSSGTTAIDLTGNKYAQSITGNAGDNILNSREGADTMTGGNGDDVFVFNTTISNASADVVTDFDVSDDVFHIENAVFKGISAGALSAGAFASNTTGNAGDATDRIIYDNDSGGLFYDKDGSGASVKIKFAQLEAGLSLTSADFFVI